MKKFLLVLFAVLLMVALCFSVKSLLDQYSEENEDKEKNPTVEDYLEKGWEIEAQYTYNGTVSENEMQYFQDKNSIKEE